MTDEQAILAALDMIEQETINAAVACIAIQQRDGNRLTPAVVIGIARAVGARPAPVLVLLGWLNATGDRPKRRLFFDLLTQTGEHQKPANQEEQAALVLAKVAARA